MWMEIEDRVTRYLINANAYHCVRKEKDCVNESIIIFYNSHGDDLILVWDTKEERDGIYEKIVEFVGKSQGRSCYGRSM
jgi:hypothetical protein